MLNPIPERLVNFSCYVDGGKLAGTVDVTLPTIAMRTEEISGAGIGGNLSTPTLGQTESMTASLTFRTVSMNAALLAVPAWHVIELRGAMQVSDVATGIVKPVVIAVTLRGQLSNYNLGTFSPATATGSTVEISVASINITQDGAPVIAIDKQNNIFAVAGVDYMAGIRAAIG